MDSFTNFIKELFAASVANLCAIAIAFLGLLSVVSRAGIKLRDMTPGEIFYCLIWFGLIFSTARLLVYGVEALRRRMAEAADFRRLQASRIPDYYQRHGARWYLRYGTISNPVCAECLIDMSWDKYSHKGWVCPICKSNIGAHLSPSTIQEDVRAHLMRDARRNDMTNFGDDHPGSRLI